MNPAPGIIQARRLFCTFIIQDIDGTKIHVIFESDIEIFPLNKSENKVTRCRFTKRTGMLVLQN